MKFAKVKVTASAPEQDSPYIYILKTAETLEIPPNRNRIMTTGLKIVEAPEVGYFDTEGVMTVPVLSSLPGVVVQRGLKIEPVEVGMDSEIKLIVWNFSGHKQVVKQGTAIAYLQLVEKLVFSVEMQ